MYVMAARPISVRVVTMSCTKQPSIEPGNDVLA